MSPTSYSVIVPLCAAAAFLASARVGTPSLTPTFDHELANSSAAHRSLARTVFAGTVRDAATGSAIAGVAVTIAGAPSPKGTTTNANGQFTLGADGFPRGSRATLNARRSGYSAAIAVVQVTGDTTYADIALMPAPTLNAPAVKATTLENRTPSRAEVHADAATRGKQAYAPPAVARAIGAASMPSPRESMRRNGAVGRIVGEAERDRTRQPADREQYDRIEDNPFLAVAGNPRSTFSIDVDRASYGNVRRFIAANQTPPADAVRIEELVNYFPYSLAEPRGADPIAITTEVAPAPWQPRHRLVRVALQARRIETAALPPSNLTFLVDVSGSMSSPDKLPLVKSSLRLLVDQLREQDRVAIVVYAGSAGLVLPSTSGSEKARIAEAIDRLEAGGSTAGGAGIQLAYKTAKDNFLRAGNNRVILASDGDFNVGASSDAEMERLIEAKRSEGVYLTILGFGTGNYQDAKMEKLAKKGNGNYAYVDDLAEARKTLVHEMGATLVTVANDVKLQVEFNPAVVAGYRLIGYEDRLLRDEDFTDDRKDAGDIGAGHTVTALYEVVPVGVVGTTTLRGTDPLRYRTTSERARNQSNDEMLYVRLRYKRPGDSTSRMIGASVASREARATASDDFRFAASVASFGMLLRNSEYKGTATPGSVLAMARGAKGEDAGGYRGEFISMVERWRNAGHIAERDDASDRVRERMPQ